MQQRGIDDEIVATLVTYGRRRHHRGGITCYMDKRTRARLESLMDGDTYRRIAGRLDRYVVLSPDGAQILTVAQRRKRLKNV